MVEFNMIEVTMVEITMRLSIGASARINLPVYERLIGKCKSERSEVKTLNVTYVCVFIIGYGVLKV